MLYDPKKKFLYASLLLQDPSDDVVLNLKDEAIALLGRLSDPYHCVGTIDKSERLVISFYELDQLPDGANIHIR